MNRLAALGRERLAAWALVLGAVVFTAIEVARLHRSSGLEVLTLLLALLAADLVIAGALVTRWYAVRPVAQGLAIFGALVHVLVLLRSGPWLVRGWSALLAVAHLYALVLFFALSAHEQYEDDEDDDEDRGGGGGEVDAAQAGEHVGVGYVLPVQRPIADLLHEVAARPVEPAAEAPAPAVAEQPVAEPEPEPSAEPGAEPSAEEPAVAGAPTERAAELGTEQPDTEQPDTEQPDTAQPDQPAESERSERAEANGATRNGANLNGTKINGSHLNGSGRDHAAERVDSGAGRRGAPEGKE